jgi:hypothetical protein
MDKLDEQAWAYRAKFITIEEPCMTCRFILFPLFFNHSEAVCTDNSGLPTSIVWLWLLCFSSPRNDKFEFVSD